MAITYPLTPPAAPGFSDLEMGPSTVVGVNRSPYTGQIQTYVWPGQWWAFRGTLPPLKDYADVWVTFLLSLNGQEGTFLMGDPSRKTTKGTAAGSKTVGASAVANTTTLPIAGGTGSFAVRDYIQVGTSRLHRVTKVNSAASVDVWPRLRVAYTAGTALTYTDPKGLFRLASNEAMRWSVNVAKHHGIVIEATEDL